MHKNIGSAERIVRVILGLAVLCILIFNQTPWRYLGLLGLIPIITGLSGVCPLYRLIGFSTREEERK